MLRCNYASQQKTRIQHHNTLERKYRMEVDVELIVMKRGFSRCPRTGKAWPSARACC